MMVSPAASVFMLFSRAAGRSDSVRTQFILPLNQTVLPVCRFLEL